MKVLRATEGSAEAQQLKREVKLHSQSKHPSIVEMIGLGKDPNDALVLVFEFMGGGDLETLLKNQAVKLDWPTRCGYAQSICDAMVFLHQAKIVHRDLK